ncbi:MAG TPA: MFS transporter [Actinomycetota bacterium]|nr:MFS transporter [Actinomycetota bacterium]
MSDPSKPVSSVPPQIPVGEAVGSTGMRRSPYRSVLKLRNFRRLWLGMTVSSLGDWIGLFALLAITDRLAPGNPLAIAGLMIFRVLPALVIGPLAGVALDRWDRRKAMMACDLLRAVLIATVPFARSLPFLYAVSFALETLSLIWMPAKDSLIPNLVPSRWLVAANSLALFTTYGVFPLGALAFTGLVGVGQLIGNQFPALAELQLNEENLALWIDAVTFLVSVALISRIDFPGLPREKRPLRFRVVVEEIKEGLRYLSERGEVARIMRGIGFALVGGAVIFSLGAPYTSQVLRGGAQSFGLVVAFLGTGMGLGVLVLGFVGDRLSKGWVFAGAIIAGGLVLVGASMVTRLEYALPVAGLLGACAGAATATAFAMLQEKVPDAVRGRTFASVQIVIRLSLFLSLIAFPSLAQLFGQVSGDAAEGVRFALALGGLLGVVAGTVAAFDVYRGRIDG